LSSILGTYVPKPISAGHKVPTLAGGSSGPAQGLAFFTWALILAVLVLLAVDRAVVMPRAADDKASAADKAAAVEEHDRMLAASLGVSAFAFVFSTAAAFAPCAK
jgi:hypothetical protein